MDATKLLSAKGDRTKNITDTIAVHMAIAEALRDLADEIESGHRLVSQLQTTEIAVAGLPSQSILLVQSALGARAAK